MANFEWALASLKQGKKVRQRGWSIGQYIYKYCGDIYYFAGVGEGRSDWSSGTSFSSRLLAEDWELYDDRPPLDGTFGSTMTAVSLGHKVKRSSWIGWTEGGRENAYVSYYDKAGFITKYCPTTRDIQATDWKYYD